MRKCVVVSPGELTLKKRNRNAFESGLVENIKSKAAKYGSFYLKKFGARYVFFTDEDDVVIQSFLKYLKYVFGLKSFFTGFFVNADYENIKYACLCLAEKDVSFKIKSKRHNKSFSYNSSDLNRMLGGEVLENVSGTKVDVHNPDQTIYLEIFNEGAMVFKYVSGGLGGLPYGTAGRVVSLFSGGIDSPVASWMIMKRGCEMIPVHFHTPPYTGEGSVLKVKELVSQLALYADRPIKTYFVNFTRLQLIIKKVVPEKYITIISRRFMVRIAHLIADENKAKGIVTGESLAQVASQTLENMLCVNDAFKITAFRPLVGLDKEEIMHRAEEIGTYRISIKKEVDCCHLFAPRRPETKGSVNGVLKAEAEVCKEIGDLLPYETNVEYIDQRF